MKELKRIKLLKNLKRMTLTALNLMTIMILLINKEIENILEHEREIKMNQNRKSKDFEFITSI